MAIYDYKCLNCDKEFEEHALMKDAEVPQPCPTCATLSPRIIKNYGMYAIKGNNDASTSPKCTVKRNRE